METQITNIGLIITALIAVVVGNLMGGATVLIIVNRVLDKINRDPALLNAIEGLTNSLPAEWVKAINLGATVVEKVTDGKPNDPVITAGPINISGTGTLEPSFLKSAEAEAVG